MKIFKTQFVIIVTKLSTYMFILLMATPLLANNIFGQSLDKTKVSISLENATVVQIFESIEKQTPFSFVYDNKTEKNAYRFSFNYKDISVRKVLEEISKEAHLKFQILNNSISVNKRTKKSKNESIITREINGKVTDKNGILLPGVNITVKDTSIGTTTDIDGNFTLEIPDDAQVIVVSYVGYKTKEIAIGNDTNFNIQLEEDANQLNEIIITGSLVATSKKEIGNAITSLKSAKLTEAGTSNVTSALAGKISGALITQNSGNPSGGVTVRLRGASSVLGSSQPLFLIDGIIVDNSSTEVLPLGGYSQNRLVDINSEDIARVEVVKGASAAAVYGSRASSGVVQIFTKKGVAGEAKVSYSSKFKINKVRKLIKENTYPYRFESNVSNDPGYNVKIPTKRYNYQNMIFRQAYGNEHNISVRGGSEKSKYYVSGSFLNNSGIIKNTDFKRYTFRTNLDLKINDWLKGSITSYYANANSDEMPNGGVIGQPFYGVLTGFSFINNYNDLSKQSDGSYNYPIGFVTNPVAALEKYKFNLDTKRFIGSIKLKANPIKNLNIEYILGYDEGITRGTGYIPPEGIKPESTGYSNSSTKNTLLLNSDLLINYVGYLNKDIKSTSTAGITQQYIYTKFFSNISNNLSPNILSTLAGQLIDRKDDTAEISIQGIFFQQSFSLYDKLFLTGAIRVDRGSPFGNNSRTQFYPKISSSYAISDEKFWKGSLKKAINNLKLRASYGEAGNLTALGAYDRFTNYNPLSYSSSQSLIPSNNMGNEDIKPERQKQIEVGFDMYTLDDRVGLGFTYYSANVEGLLLKRTLAPSSGFDSRLENIGTLTNKGFEIELTANPLTIKDFSWNFSIIYSKNRNRMNNISGGSVLMDGGFDGLIIAKNKEPIGIFQGSYFLRDEKGNILKDSRGIPLQSTDKKKIGDPNPDWLGSFINEISYKGWKLKFQFDAVIGFDVFNWTNRLKAHTDLFGGGKLDEDEVRGILPRGYNSAHFQTFERYVEDGSFVKLRELYLQHRFLFGKDNDKKLLVFMSGRNLFSIDGYSGWDPETSSFGQRSGIRGQDFNGVPIPMTFELGFKINF